MDETSVYRGIVKTGRGAGAQQMSAAGVLDGFQQLTGLTVIPGTLNLDLVRPLDLSLLEYVTFAGLGMPPTDLRALGIDHDGEQGVHYRRVVVAGRYPGCLLSFTWVDRPGINAEVVSPHHLRSILGLRDGDILEFCLV